MVAQIYKVDVIGRLEIIYKDGFSIWYFTESFNTVHYMYYLVTLFGIIPLSLGLKLIRIAWSSFYLNKCTVFELSSSVEY